MERRICVICFNPAVIIPYSLSLLKWQDMWNNFHSQLPSTVISKTCLDKILINDDVSFCKGCFDSSMELTFIMEKIKNFNNEKARLISVTLNGILQRRNVSRIVHNLNVNVETKKMGNREGPKESVVLESDANIEIIKIEDDNNTQCTDDSLMDVESIVPAFTDCVNEVEINHRDSAVVETPTVLVNENGTDASDPAVVTDSSVQVVGTIPMILLNRVRVESDASNETAYLLENPRSNVLETSKPKSFTKGIKGKESKQASKHTTGKSPKAACKKRIVAKKAAGKPKKTQKKSVHNIFKCQLCNRILKSKHNLEVHTNAHNEQKVSSSRKGCPSTVCSPASSKQPYECSLCEKKTFSTKFDLKQHEKTHKAERDFKCSICNNIFSSKSNLKAHEENHSKNRRNAYKCFLCLKRFYRYEQRTAHHAEFHNLRVRSYECLVCHETFSLKNNLMIHALIHTEDRNRPFQCSVCDKAYYHKGFLARHEKLHSKDQL